MPVLHEKNYTKGRTFEHPSQTSQFTSQSVNSREDTRRGEGGQTLENTTRGQQTKRKVRKGWDGGRKGKMAPTAMAADHRLVVTPEKGCGRPFVCAGLCTTPLFRAPQVVRKRRAPQELVGLARPDA